MFKFGQTFMLGVSVLTAGTALATPVPSYVPPVTTQSVQPYADDTRGVYVPQHQQHRHATIAEQQQMRLALAQLEPAANGLPSLADGDNVYDNALNNIATNPGILAQPEPQIPADQATQPPMAYQFNGQIAQNGMQIPQGYPAMQPYGTAGGYSVAPMIVPVPVPMNMAPQQAYATSQPTTELAMNDGGNVLVGDSSPAVMGKAVDMHNAVVSLREDRITVRRALQRMMDQIGAGHWVVVWDLAEQNAGLPETEISIQTEEPFLQVLNALVARVQAQSGQPLRVIRYDRTQRLVITDRAPGDTTTTRAASGTSTIGDVGEAAITEQVLKESLVSLHYDEIPLVDALENVVHQAGKGQWRLRMYAGSDQVLKPAHIEEPFGVAMERLLKLFNLQYEIFPGGKLIVITEANRFGFNSWQNSK